MQRGRHANIPVSAFVCWRGAWAVFDNILVKSYTGCMQGPPDKLVVCSFIDVCNIV